MEQNSQKYKETITVIGGGIGGLFSAWNLLKEGYDVTVLERQNHLGGLSTSIPYDGYQMDIGPHFITTPKNSILSKELEELMKNEGANNVIYDLMGREVNNLNKGVMYIRNQKKFIILR